MKKYLFVLILVMGLFSSLQAQRVGLVLSGGGALLKGLPERISRETHCPVFIAPEPLGAVALGAGKCAEDFNTLKKYLRYSK